MSKAVRRSNRIRLQKITQNNLRGFDLELEPGLFHVVTGPSGSGKSSLAFDTLYAEGQRRYVETFSPYTRQFFERMDKPRLESAEGILPAIAIQQVNQVRTTRSTVGTITEINDYLKLFMARTAKSWCPSCHNPIQPETAISISRRVEEEAADRDLLVLFGPEVSRKSDPVEWFQFLQSQGYLRVLWEDDVVRTDQTPPGPLPQRLAVIQDRIRITSGNRSRLREAVETALRLGKGRIRFRQLDGAYSRPFSNGWHCAECDLDIRPPSPGLFSFNHPLGACPTCRGFGRTIRIDYRKALPDPSLSLAGGAVKAFQSSQYGECQRDLLKAAAAREIDVNTPFRDLPKADQEFVLEGDPAGRELSSDECYDNGIWYGVRGFFDWMEGRTYKMHVRVFLSRYRSYELCPDCNGGRYQPETLCHTLSPGRGKGFTLPELATQPISELAQFFNKFRLPAKDRNTKLLLETLQARLGYLLEVGLGYLTLDRATRTLSGGELQRVNLTTCLGAALVNTLFVLDEPSIGLHPRDTSRLIGVMHRLRDRGNTLVVVEHEEAVIRAADNLVDLGPGRGEGGGRLLHNGPLTSLLSKKRSLTADYLSGRRRIEIPARRRSPGKDWLTVRGASAHNLRNVTARFPVGLFTCVTGVSGSGKSTLVHHVLYSNLRGDTASDMEAGACKSIRGKQHFNNVVLVDQSPLARTPRSTPAVYIGIYDFIRERYARLPESRAAGLTAGWFSFNSGRGRCERCQGNGFEKVEMQFLSDLYFRCPACEGRRFKDDLLQIRLEGKSIGEVLEMTVTEAIKFFGKLKEDRITGPLRRLEETGLGYLRLGQPLTTLSGGESQRLKLVGHLESRKGRESGKSLLIFDEPTTGLHFDDIARLVEVFQKLTDQGHTLVVIEHNLDVIKNADYVIDLGPEAGEAGGRLVAEGTPEEIAATADSHTGRYLKSVLKPPRKSVAKRKPASSQRKKAGAGDSRIQIHGAREHNLKNIDVSIPRDRTVVVTGLSGSGKSSLAFDLLFAEGQRRFLDSMSPYARQFAEQMEKPDVDRVEGLPPTVAIEQRVTRGGGKSTVATITEAYQFLRLLFAKTGTQYCPSCQVPVEKQDLESVHAVVQKALKQGSVRLFAPLVRARKGFHTEVAEWARKQGFETLLVDGKLTAVTDFRPLERYREHSIDVLVGEISPKTKAKLANTVERAIGIGKGTARLLDRHNRFTVLSTEMACPDCGRAFDELDPRLFSFNSPHGWCPECRGFGSIKKGIYTDTGRFDSVLEEELYEEKVRENTDTAELTECPSCHGDRIREEARQVRIGDLGISDFNRRSAHEALDLLDQLQFDPWQRRIARDLLPEIRQRLEFMSRVGLDYLALNRSAKTLSGGESQRIRLASQLGSSLRGVLYVLDEPTIGLHPSDNQRLLGILDELKTKGNTLLVVEHDEETMRQADHIIDLGPGAGVHGGQVVAEGDLSQILKNGKSVTGRAMKEKLRHPLRGERRSLETVPGWLEVEGASANNLQNIDVKIPLERLTVLTGVSGSGKSSLMRGVLYPAVHAALQRGRKKKTVAKPEWVRVSGMEQLRAVYEVDQSPIGKTSRSTPATYIKVFDEIRKLYAQLATSRMRGYEPSRFSFNTGEGRCQACAGQGVIKLEMNFLPAGYIPCEECGGRRFNEATCEVLYNERSIADVMEMSIEQASVFFQAQPRIHRPLRLLEETGLGYLRLGQPSPTLSGGEAQRLKLVTELSRAGGGTRSPRPSRESRLYLLEEPTIGLHRIDVLRLIEVLHRLVDEGQTVVLIEHQMDVIAEADYLIDIGPGAGVEGGRVVASGTPEEVAKHPQSKTAPFLKRQLG